MRTEDLKTQLKVDSVRSTNLISVAYRNQSPELAAAVVNTLARVVLERNQKLNQEEIASTKDFLEKQLTLQKETLAEAESSVLEFKKSHKSFSLEEEAQALVNTQVGLESRRMELDTGLKGALAQKADLSAKMGARDAVLDYSYSYWATTLEQVNNQITSLTAQQRNVDRQIAEVKASLGQLPPVEIELARLLRNEKIASDIYTTLLGQYEETRMNEAAKIASIRLVEPAIVPDRPAFPEKGKYLLLAALVGLVAGVGIALLREHFDDSVRSVAEVRRLLPYDILGYIPYQQTDTMLYLTAAPQSPASEAFRLVHANLKFKPVISRKTFSIMVTSAMPEEGKSTIATNLSLAFATNGTRVALVNLDLRRPSFNAIFGLRARKGVTDFLIGESSMEDIMVRENGRNLTIIPTGTVPPNPSELVASQKVRQMMGYLAEHFDVVVYDTPPVTLVAEALDLARHVDGLILVVDISAAPRSALRAMHELIGNKDLAILGTVLNKVNRKDSAYRYYGGSYSGKPTDVKG